LLGSAAVPAIDVHIDLDKVLEIAHLGARRASIFLGLGVNAARNPEMRDCHLPVLFKMSPVPEHLDDAAIRHCKEEFEAWIVGNGLRELIETFSVYLDRIFEVCIIASGTGPIDNAQVVAAVRPFAGKSVSDKLSQLQAAYGIATSHSGMFPGLKNARNCLSHRLGIVGDQDVNLGDELIISWLGFNVTGLLPDGREEHIPPGHEGPFSFSEAARVRIGQAQRERRFRKAEMLRLLTWELGEIVWAVTQAASEIRSSMLGWGQARGNLTVRTEK